MARNWPSSPRKPPRSSSGTSPPGSRKHKCSQATRLLIEGLDVSPDSQLLATGSHDGTVRIWEVATAKLVVLFKGHAGRVNGVAFSRNGQTLATCGWDSTIKLWNLTIQQEVVTLRGHRGPVASVAFSPDGNLLASSGADATVRLWPAAPFQESNGQADHRAGQ